VAIHNPRTKLWDIYGVITAISPNRKYYIKTSSGRVLVRNRRFLRKRVPLSIPTRATLKIHPPISLLENFAAQQEPGNHLVV